MTSVSGRSILPQLLEADRELHKEVSDTLNNYSAKPDRMDPTKPVRVEVVDGFRLLGSPVGSASFAAAFFEDQLKEVRRCVTELEGGITDLQT